MRDPTSSGPRAESDQLPHDSTQPYEPPAIEDLDTDEGPSVTAAGATTLAAPRQL